jgi:hypothetical protein
MQLTENIPPPIAAAEHVVPGESQTIHQCDECGAPVDNHQRYCVSCGAHRRHVNDPAARYLSQATARSRSVKAAATAREAPRTGARSRSLALALAIAIIPVAAAAGVIAGRSSNNDAKLIQALDQRRSAAVATATVPAATSSASTQTKALGHAKAKRHAKKSSSNGTPLARNAGKVISKTQNGTAQQITGFKPTKSQEQQGASATQKVQKSTGKSYVNGQSNLPSQVVVP